MPAADSCAGGLIFDYWPFQRLALSVHYYSVLRRLVGWRFRPRRDRQLALGSAGLLLTSSLFWVTPVPDDQPPHLIQNAPRSSPPNPLALRHRAVYERGFKVQAHLSSGAPKLGLASQQLAYTELADSSPSGLAIRRSAPLPPADSTALDAFALGLSRCWQVVKLSFR